MKEDKKKFICSVCGCYIVNTTPQFDELNKPYCKWCYKVKLTHSETTSITRKFELLFPRIGRKPNKRRKKRPNPRDYT